ncbi:MAG: SAM-dependent methyltransferase, partial [SAR202 cluster bacterium]|nr:SAM-dependent methyltransferase [SAR202 cluster bacterium]
NINLKIWLDSVQSVIEEGVILFIDYGYAASDYYHPNKPDGNLLCHYRHNAHNNPFFYPGLQDITSSVDFTAVAQYAEELGLHVKGYNNQTYFLFGCGLEDLIPDMNSLDIKSQTMIAQQLRTLTMPDEMGERFKVIALAKKYNKKLLGFSIMNQRTQL